MEEILKKIIEIDNKAKAISFEEKKRKENFEEALQKEFNTQKEILDAEYKNEITKQQEIYEGLFEEKRKEINKEISNRISDIETHYRTNENRLVEDIVNSIKKGD